MGTTIFIFLPLLFSQIRAFVSLAATVPHFLFVNSEGLGQTVWLYRLSWVITVCIWSKVHFFYFFFHNTASIIWAKPCENISSSIC